MSATQAEGKFESTAAACDTAPEIDDRIRVIAADIFQVDVKSIDLSLGPDEVDRWDSMNHLRLITEVENAFSVRLTMQEIQKIGTLEDIATFVSRPH